MTTTFEPDLLARCDRPGPRYTSYPSSLQFTPAFTAADFRRHARRSNEEPIPRDLSLYVHVPYCFSPCFYCGCNRIITRDYGRAAPYTERVIREAESVAPLFDRSRALIQMHFGGGTPNFLTADQLGQLVDAFGKYFRFSCAADRDFSIELDPRTVREGDIAAYARMGFNRASLGVQDFDRTVQLAINREQSVEQTLKVIEDCRLHGFRSVNVDLIYGLPKQSAPGFGNTLDIVLRARPDRIAIYGYAHMPEMFKAQRQIVAADLPDAARRVELLSLAIEKLTGAGYLHVGLDHFALPEDDLGRALANRSLHRNFMGYTTHADCDLIGLGVSSISHVGDSYSQNFRDLTAWEVAVDKGDLPTWRGIELDDDDLVRADVIQQIMCRGEVDLQRIEQKYDLAFDEYFADALAQLVPLQEDGLVDVDPERIAATSRGRLLLRMMAMCFDHYLRTPAQAERPRHSRVV
ncbi:MAG TPA: oxygen-independent coproporphyrinogen III oxidase [Steroidobacteraceae bacterium]